jgi:hypothetical protein
MFWSAVVRNKTNFRTCGVLQKFKFNAQKKKTLPCSSLEFILKPNPTQISSTKQQSSTDLTQAFDRTFIKIGSFVNLQKPMKKPFLLQQ